MEQIVFLNGDLIPRSRANISPFDHGFLYGYALFETMRVYSGKIFLLNRHLDRLIHSAEYLNIPLQNIDLEESCYKTLKANNLEDARIRLTVSIGEGDAIPDRPTDPNPTIIIIVTPYTSLPSELYQSGFKAVTSSIQQNSQSPLSRMKTANYLSSLLARQEAKAAEANEALLLNERGVLCEGSTSNVFVVLNDVLITPNVESGCLAGITREAVIALALTLGINLIERGIMPNELAEADEAFLTNSLLEIMPLVEVDGKPIGHENQQGKPGPITKRIMEAYAELVAREI